MPPIGFSCALKGSCCQQRGPAASTATTTDTLVPKTQTTSPTTPRFSAFFAEVVCTLGTTQPQTAISPSPNGGNGVIRTTTRRRHADSQPLMLQNPHRHRYGGCRRDRGAWPDNEPTRRSKLAARTAEVGGADTTASQISHAIPPQHEATQAQRPQSIDDQNPNSDMRSRELHAKLLVDSHSWASRRCTEPQISTPSLSGAQTTRGSTSNSQRHTATRSVNPSVILGA